MNVSHRRRHTMFDQTTLRKRVRCNSFEGNFWAASWILPILSGVHVIRSRSAMNVSIDGAPIFGETPSVTGFFNTVTVHDVTMGPLIGLLNVAMVTSGKAGRDPGAYSIAWFV